MWHSCRWAEGRERGLENGVSVVAAEIRRLGEARGRARPRWPDDYSGPPTLAGRLFRACRAGRGPVLGADLAGRRSGVFGVAGFHGAAVVGLAGRIGLAERVAAFDGADGGV